MQEKSTAKNKVEIDIAEVEQVRQLHKTTSIINKRKTMSFCVSTRHCKQAAHRARQASQAYRESTNKSLQHKCKPECCNQGEKMESKENEDARKEPRNIQSRGRVTRRLPFPNIISKHSC
jgi:hypothetical protein